MPRWVKWQEREEQYTLRDSKTYMDTNKLMAGDATENVTLSLKKKCLRIYGQDGEKLWESPSSWKIADAFFTDVDHDGAKEAVLLLWKRGSYGEKMPFWVEENESGWSEHIFIYDWDMTRSDRLLPIWMSSKMGYAAAELSYDEKDRLHLTEADGTEILLNWESWGLTILN